MQAAQKHGIDIAKRPTGGGILFHLNDFVFTVAIPATHKQYHPQVLENYRWINEAVARALSLADRIELARASAPQSVYSSFCMATPTIYDIIFDGKKIGGSAQRKTKNGYIHQASLFFRSPPWHIIEDILLDKEAARAMRKNSSFLDCISKNQMREALIQELY